MKLQFYPLGYEMKPNQGGVIHWLFILGAFVGCSGSDNLDTFKTSFFIDFVRSYLGQFFSYDFFDALVF